jgi:hypothetical protein
MKVNLNRLKKMAHEDVQKWTGNDYRMAHHHLTHHLGWDMTKASVNFWDFMPIANATNHARLYYINPRTGGVYNAPGAIKYLVEHTGMRK